MYTADDVRDLSNEVFGKSYWEFTKKGAADLINAAVAKALEQQWQPIETAPINELIEVGAFYPEHSMTDIEVCVLITPWNNRAGRPYWWRKHIPIPNNEPNTASQSDQDE